MSGLTRSLFGSGQNTFSTSVNTAPMTKEERELVKLNTALTRKQLQQIDQLAPFQKELIELSMADLRRQSALNASGVSPEDQAAFEKEEFERARKLGPIQDQILEMQMANMRGELTPGQQAAANAAIEAGYGDIDRATSEGLGLISDEIANARGLRLTDTPILREATMLAESGMEQKAGLARNVRAQALLQMPQISSGIGLAQQGMADQAKAFQAELRNRAAMNRMSLFGQTSSGGIGLASVGSGAGASALSSLSGVRAQNTQSSGHSFNPSQYMSGFGNFMQGLGGMSRGIGMAMMG